MASPLWNRVCRVSDMRAISVEATATAAEVTAVTLVLVLSAYDGDDELDKMGMLGECLREKQAWDAEKNQGNEGRFAVSSSLLLHARQRISNCNLSPVRPRRSQRSSSRTTASSRPSTSCSANAKGSSLPSGARRVPSFDDGKAKVPRLSNMLPRVTTS
jgi:hypothetical protein